MKLKWFENIPEAKAKGALDGLEKLANEIQSLSQSRCPVDTGTLRGSARTQREDTKVMVGYGGAASGYSVDQHENMSYHHEVGQAKFLESAFDELKSKAKDYVKASIK